MSVSTRIATNTRTQTAVFLADTIMGAFSEVIAVLGLSHTSLTSQWTIIENGIKQWIEEGSLSDVVLECGPTDRPYAVFEIPIQYSYGTGEVEFVASKARLARYLAKLATVPAGATYRVVTSHNGPHAPMPGWSATTRASTVDMSSYSLGSLGRAPDASISARYLTR
jgi:Bacterial HORMA domain 2